MDRWHEIAKRKAPPTLSEREVDRWADFEARPDLAFTAQLPWFVRCYTDGLNNRRCCRKRLPLYIERCADLCDGDDAPQGRESYRDKYALCLTDPVARSALDTCNREALTAGQQFLKKIGRRRRRR